LAEQKKINFQRLGYLYPQLGEKRPQLGVKIPRGKNKRNKRKKALEFDSKFLFIFSPRYFHPQLGEKTP
jgi:hypothetical protein